MPFKVPGACEDMHFLLLSRYTVSLVYQISFSNLINLHVHSGRNIWNTTVVLTHFVLSTISKIFQKVENNSRYVFN